MLRGGSAADQVRSQVRRRGAIRVADLRLRGFEVDTASPVVGDWLVDEDRRDQWADQLRRAARLASDRPLDPGLAADVAVRELGLPDPALLPVVARAAGLDVVDGRVNDPHADHGLGPAEPGVRLLEDHLAARPFLAPEHDQLDDWGLGVRELAAAERLQRVVRLTPEIVLLPTGPALAMRELARLPQPFTASEARTALGTTRRVLIPLLEHLDRRGWTERVDQNRRRIRPIDRGRRVQG